MSISTQSRMLIILFTNIYLEFNTYRIKSVIYLKKWHKNCSTSLLVYDHIV